MPSSLLPHIFLLNLLFSGAGQAYAQESPSTRIDIDRENAALLRTDFEFSAMSAQKGMSVAFLAYIGEGAVMLPQGSAIIEGTEQIRHVISQSGSHATLTWKPWKAEVSSSGDLGFTYGTYESHSVGEDGKPVVHFGKYVSVWRKQKDRTWKWIVDVGNEGPAPH